MIANNKVTPKIIKVFSAIPLPESIRVLFDRSKSHVFEVSMRNEYYSPPKDGNFDLTECQAAIINPLIKINKETLDGAGKDLKVFYAHFLFLISEVSYF